MNNKILLCSVSIVMLTACTTPPQVQQETIRLRSSKIQKSAKITPLNTVLEREIGESVYEKGALVTEFQEVAIFKAGTLLKLPSGHFLKIPVGSEMKLSYGAEKYEPTVCFVATTDDNKNSVPADISAITADYVENSAALAFLKGGVVGLLLKPPSSDLIACLMDTGKIGSFNDIRSNSTINNINISSYIPYTANPRANFTIDSKGSVRQDLIYQGMANRIARFSYREFYDGISRPAFTQEVVYEIEAKGGTEIGFRGLRLQIESINNQNITYKILKDMN